MTTLPFLMLNWLPWHGQSMVPLATWSTRQPWWVHTALNALKWPAAGWVTTTFSEWKILPLPTGMALVAVSAAPSRPSRPPSPTRPTRPAPGCPLPPDFFFAAGVAGLAAGASVAPHAVTDAGEAGEGARPARHAGLSLPAVVRTPASRCQPPDGYEIGAPPHE